MKPQLAQARALRADIVQAPDIWLPRREILLQWLEAYLVRADAGNYAGDEAADLDAVDQFLRQQKVPVAGA